MLGVADVRDTESGEDTDPVRDHHRSADDHTREMAHSPALHRNVAGEGQEYREGGKGD